MHSDEGEPGDPLRDRIIGLGERSFRKSYYPELQHKLADLQRFRALLDESNDAIFMIDVTDGRLTDASGSVCRYLGLDSAALLKMTIYDLVDEVTAARIGGLFAGKEEFLSLTATMEVAGGRAVPFEFTIKIARMNGVSSAVAVARDITERRAAEEQIKATLREKEVMLKEIHHRVKNNLQVISSLLNIQAQYLADGRDIELFRRSQDRVRSMALVHEKLYQTDDLAVIDFSPYIESLVHNLLVSYRGDAGDVRPDIDVAGVFLDIDTAIPCGLIVNELVSNALKHAFPGGRAGRITVRMRQGEGSYVLEISDDGAGLSHSPGVEKSQSMGLQLVTLLTEQLDGTMSVDTSHGTKFTIVFKAAAGTGSAADTPHHDAGNSQA
jgi:two-component system, sensor histidine kinase PdtaS